MFFVHDHIHINSAIGIVMSIWWWYYIPKPLYSSQTLHMKCLTTYVFLWINNATFPLQPGWYFSRWNQKLSVNQWSKGIYVSVLYILPMINHRHLMIIIDLQVWCEKWAVTKCLYSTVYNHNHPGNQSSINLQICHCGLINQNQ